MTDKRADQRPETAPPAESGAAPASARFDQAALRRAQRKDAWRQSLTLCVLVPIWTICLMAAGLHVIADARPWDDPDLIAKRIETAWNDMVTPMIETADTPDAAPSLLDDLRGAFERYNGASEDESDDSAWRAPQPRAADIENR